VNKKLNAKITSTLLKCDWCNNRTENKATDIRIFQRNVSGLSSPPHNLSSTDLCSTSSGTTEHLAVDKLHDSCLSLYFSSFWSFGYYYA